MREIKFRAWNEVQEKMLNWYDFLDTNIKNTFVAPESTGLILMQYTGLKDDNEKEIYEGDILLIDAYTYTNPVFSEEYLVQYNEVLGMWQLINLENYKKDKKDKEDFMTFEDFKGWYRLDIAVIGNVYDNPELLKESK